MAKFYIICREGNIQVTPNKHQIKSTIGNNAILIPQEIFSLFSLFIKEISWRLNLELKRTPINWRCILTKLWQNCRCISFRCRYLTIQRFVSLRLVGALHQTSHRFAHFELIVHLAQRQFGFAGPEHRLTRYPARLTIL